MQRHLSVIASVILFSIIPFVFADQGTYNLEAHGKTFDVTYDFNGKVIAMVTDQEATSLLIGIRDVKNSVFVISFSSELLSAKNAEFVVLVDGLETDYTITYDGNNPTITFPVLADSEEIEIIGTSVVPEFPLGALAILGIVSAILAVFSRTKLRLFK
jgi:hypothetical protein